MRKFQDWRRLKFAEGEAHGWIQFKGTDLCMDLRCSCGALGHVDADFAYFVQCQACGQVYELSGHVEVRPVPKDEKHGTIVKIAFVDEEEEDDA